MPEKLEWELLDGVTHPNIIIAKCDNTGRRYNNRYYNIYPSGKYVKEWEGEGDVVYIVDSGLFNTYTGPACYVEAHREELFSKHILKSTIAAYFHTYSGAIETSELFHRMIELKHNSKITLVDCQNNGERGNDLAKKYGTKIVHCPCESGYDAFRRCEGTRNYFESLIRNNFDLIDSSKSLGV